MKSDYEFCHKKLSDGDLLELTMRAAKTEKEATLALLDYLVETDSRKLYASVSGCSSLFDYLVKILGLSHPAAAERVNTVRLIRAVPPVKEHLETGKLTLTSAAQIQRFVNAEQKVNPKNKSVSFEEKEKVIEACLGKSKREVEKTLFQKHSEPARALVQEKVRSISADRTEIKFTVGENTLEKIQQLKDFIGNQSLEKIFDEALDALLFTEKKKRGVVPANKVTSTDIPVTPTRAPFRGAAGGTSCATVCGSTGGTPTGTGASTVRGQPADWTTLETRGRNERTKSAQTEALRTEAQLNSRFIPIDLKRFVFARSKGQCEFIDPRTKIRCDSKFRLQIDHELPRALGGKTEASNLRHLCAAHNLRMAMQAGLNKPKVTANL